MNNGFLVFQEKGYEKSNAILFCSYSIILSLFNQFSLVIKHDKSDIFHLSRSIKNINLPLDLRPVGGAILRPKNTWKYLGFFFNKKLSFQYYIYYYANKALSTIKSIRMLGNSTSSLFPIHKHLLYRMCVLLNSS